MPYPESPASKKLGVHYVYLITYLVGLSAFGSFVNDMYLPSLPSMVRFFHTTVPTVQLGLTFGMIGLGIGQLVLGPVSDKYGRKPVIYGSLLLFLTGAVVSIFSPTIQFFIGCRLIQGLGASGGYFLARTIPADIYMGRPLAKTMAIVGAINGFAPACAPVVGGIVSDHFTWKGVFVVLSLCAVALICMTPHLKETLSPERRTKGSIWQTLSSYKSLLRNRPFMIHVMLKGTALSFLFAYISSAPFIMQDHYGWSQTVFGFFMGGNAMCVATGSLVALRFKVLKRGAFVGAWILMGAALAEGVALWFFHSFWLYELLLLPCIFGLGMLFTVSNTLAMNEGRADAGGASAVLGIVGYLFGALVAPLIGKGNIMHSTAIVFVVLAGMTLLFAFLSRSIPADLGTAGKDAPPADQDSGK